jgi:hypothetical protein
MPSRKLIELKKIIKFSSLKTALGFTSRNNQFYDMKYDMYGLKRLYNNFKAEEQLLIFYHSSLTIRQYNFSCLLLRFAAAFELCCFVATC